MPSKPSQKIIITHKYNLDKIKSIIKSKNPEVLLLESENASLNTKTNSIAYKLVMDGKWIGIETRRIKRKRDDGLLRITLINNKFIDKYMKRN